MMFSPEETSAARCLSVSALSQMLKADTECNNNGFLTYIYY